MFLFLEPPVPLQSNMSLMAPVTLHVPLISSMTICRKTPERSERSCEETKTLPSAASMRMSLRKSSSSSSLSVSDDNDASSPISDNSAPPEATELSVLPRDIMRLLVLALLKSW